MTSPGGPHSATSSLKPIDALNRLWDIALGYCLSQVFWAGCSLGVFEELGRSPATPAELSQRIKIHPEGCRRLLAALEHLGLVEREEQRVRNTALGAYCTSKSPVNMSALVGASNPFYRMWEYLPDALREYGPRWQQALGTDSNEVFASLYADPARLRRFAMLMNASSIPQGQEVANRIDFSPFKWLLDVAGGPGGIGVQIGLRHKHLRGIIMDMAPVCEVAREYIASCGLQDRFTTAAGDLFTGPYPAGADVITLGHILHDWSDDHCRQILRNCYNALPSGGMVLVVEKVLNPDHSGTRAALMLDLMMLVACESGARERNESEYRALLEEAGFRQVEVLRLEAPRDVVKARKP